MRGMRRGRVEREEAVEKECSRKSGWSGENDRLKGANTVGKIQQVSMRQPERDTWREARERVRERGRERDRARELHAIRITSSIPQSGYVIFVAQLIEGRSMHILNFNTKRCLLMGRKQNNQYNFAINCCFAEEQDAWVTCKQQLIIAMRGKNACFRKSREALSSLQLHFPRWHGDL